MEESLYLKKDDNRLGFRYLSNLHDIFTTTVIIREGAVVLIFSRTSECVAYSKAVAIQGQRLCKNLAKSTALIRGAALIRVIMVCLNIFRINMQCNLKQCSCIYISFCFYHLENCE